MSGQSDELNALLERAGEGESRALGELFARFHERLLRVVSLRMDRRLSGRVDPADIVQESFVTATARFQEYRLDPQPMPFYLWLRFLTVQKLMEIHRAHFEVQARDVTREVSLRAGPFADSSSALIAERLMANQTSPSQAALRLEIQQRLEQALRSMDPMDQEIITLRNFEQLTNTEVAQVLAISESAASNRYIRALKRLRVVLDDTAAHP